MKINLPCRLSFYLNQKQNLENMHNITHAVYLEKSKIAHFQGKCCSM